MELDFSFVTDFIIRYVGEEAMRWIGFGLFCIFFLGVFIVQILTWYNVADFDRRTEAK